MTQFSLLSLFTDCFCSVSLEIVNNFKIEGQSFKGLTSVFIFVWSGKLILFLLLLCSQQCRFQLYFFQYWNNWNHLLVRKQKKQQLWSHCRFSFKIIKLISSFSPKRLNRSFWFLSALVMTYISKVRLSREQMSFHLKPFLRYASAAYVFLCIGLLTFISVSQHFSRVLGIEKTFLPFAGALRWFSHRNTTFLCMKWIAVQAEMSPEWNSVGEKMLCFEVQGPLSCCTLGFQKCTFSKIMSVTEQK